MGGVPSVELSFLMSTTSWRGEYYDGGDGDNGEDYDGGDSYNPAVDSVIECIYLIYFICYIYAIFGE